MERTVLLVSDVDDTLIGDDTALLRLVDWLSPRRAGLRLAYASGRFFESIAQTIATTPLPAPDAIIGGVGTEIRAFPDGTTLAFAGPNPPPNWDPERIFQALGAVDGIALQPAAFRSDRKVSFFLHQATAEILADVGRRLQSADIDADMVYSSRRDLDILPRGVHKGAAAQALAQAWGFAPDEVFVSGDSGNDLSMFQMGFRGIVVANAHAELRALRGPRVYQAAGAFAEGVREGLAHWLAQDGRA